MTYRKRLNNSGSAGSFARRCAALLFVFLLTNTHACASELSKISDPSVKFTWMVRFDRRNKMACFVRSQFLTCGRYGDEDVDEFDDDRAAAARVSATARGKTSGVTFVRSSPFEP